MEWFEYDINRGITVLGLVGYFSFNLRGFGNDIDDDDDNDYDGFFF